MRRAARLMLSILLGLLLPAIASAITIDATALSPASFRVAAPVQGPFPTNAVQNVPLGAGTYTFIDEANGIFSFDVDAGGLVSYDSALESFLDGAGTSTLTVRGFDITVDARTLTTPQFALPHVTGSTTATSWRPTSTVQSVTVLPSDVGFFDFASNLIVFSVDGNGNVQYPSGAADYLQGAGTPNLVVRGFDFTVDARTLSTLTFSLAGITGLTTASSQVDRTVVLAVTGIPGLYDFRDSIGNDFLFSIDEDGIVGYSPTFDGFLDGAGSTALLVQGFTLTVDVRGIASSAPTFAVPGMINPGNSSVVQSWVGIPGFYLFSSAIDLFFFTVDLSGHYQGLPALYGSFAVTGNGTALLQIGTVTTNHPPVVSITGPASGTVIPVGASTLFSGSFSDDAGDTHTAVWTFDGASQAGTVSESGHTVTATHVFSSPGVYFVTLTVTDDHGASGTATTVDGLDAIVVVYDPNGGFVTGGGWINSPIGAYVAQPSLTGKANFGFESKYKSGASTPSGETEFQFKIASLNFHSTSYDWLVVAGARAQYKGSGTINGQGDYAFMLTAIDGELLGGSASDKFRMKIWDKGSGQSIYDNQLGAADSTSPTTALGGGSIVVHKGTGSGPARAQWSPFDETPTAFALHPLSPNPMRSGTRISFSLPSSGAVTLAIYDLAGRQVASLASGVIEAGRHAYAWNGREGSGSKARPGLYFVRLEASTQGGRMVATRKLTVVR